MQCMDMGFQPSGGEVDGGKARFRTWYSVHCIRERTLKMHAPFFLAWLSREEKGIDLSQEVEVEGDS